MLFSVDDVAYWGLMTCFRGVRNVDWKLVYVDDYWNLSCQTS